MEIRGVDLNVNSSGVGPAFVWGHGLMSSMALEDITGWFPWDDFNQDVNLVRYDARGHGRSQATLNPEDYVWTNLAQDMLALADGLPEKSFIAGGQSMGCATSICAAMAAPQRVKALVLMNPPTAWETRAAQTGMYGQMAGLVEAHGVAALAANLQPELLLPAWLVEAQPKVGAAFVAAVASMDDKTLPQILRGAALCDLPSREDLPGLTMPALILAWSEDNSHPLETAETLLDLMPNAQMAVAKGMEELATWPDLISAFVANNA